MATKKQLLETLDKAFPIGHGFSMTDDKADLEAAVAALDPVADRRRGV